MTEQLTVYARLFIPGPLPGTNDYLRARSRGMKPMTRGPGARSGNAYQKLKQEWEGRIRLLCTQARIRMLPPCCYTYLYFEPHRLRNPDNIASFSKFVFDALVAKPHPIIPNDGWTEIQDFRSYWLVEPRHIGVTVFAADRVLSCEEALEADAAARAKRPGVSGYACRPTFGRRVARS